MDGWARPERVHHGASTTRTHNLTQPFLLFFRQTMSYIVEIQFANDITKPINMVELDQCIDPQYIAVCTRDNKGSFIIVKKAVEYNSFAITV